MVAGTNALVGGPVDDLDGSQGSDSLEQPAIGTVVVLSVYELYCFAKIKLHQRGLTAPSLQTGFQPL